MTDGKNPAFPLTEGEREFWMRVVWGPNISEPVEDNPQYRAASLKHLLRSVFDRGREQGLKEAAMGWPEHEVNA